MQFAPVSSRPSVRLQLVAGYFTLTGSALFALVSIGVVMRAFLMQSPLPVTLPMFALRMVGAAITALGLLWTGRALRQQRRAGWWSALAAVVSPLVTLSADAPGAWVTVTATVIGLMLLVSVHKELD